MVTILVVGLIAWVLAGAVEDNIRAVRGDAPRETRPGFRGYLDDRWKALADRHERARTGDLMTAYTARQQRRHLAREKALAFAGYKTSEEIARAAAEHRRRLGLIDRGVDPDTGEGLGEPDPVEQAEPEGVPEAPSVEDHFESAKDVWEDPDLAPPPESSHDPQPGIDDYYPPEPSGKKANTATPDPWAHAQPWSPYATSNTDKKETPMEINSPADVKRFHDALKASMDGVATIVDTLNGLATDLDARAGEVRANVTATDTAAAGMTGLGMEDGAVAARALLEAQQAIAAAMGAIVTALQQHGATITDQTQAAHTHLAAVKRAHDAQLMVQDARRAAGRRNLAKDTYLDRD